MNKKIKTIEFVAFVDGEPVTSTGKFEFDSAMADEFMDMSNNISSRIIEMYTEEAERIVQTDFL